MNRNLTPREEKLLQLLDAMGLEAILQTEKNQADIEYMAILQDIDIFDNEEEEQIND